MTPSAFSPYSVSMSSCHGASDGSIVNFRAAVALIVVPHWFSADSLQ